jgi:hypothetical protein
MDNTGQTRHADHSSIDEFGQLADLAAQPKLGGTTRAVILAWLSLIHILLLFAVLSLIVHLFQRKTVS